MDFAYPPEAEAFRDEFRAWLDAQPAPTTSRGAASAARSSSTASALERLRAWNRTLADARYAAIAWPEEWGGRGAGRDGTGRVRRGDAPRAARRARSTRSASRTSRPRSSSTAPTSRSATLLPRMLRGDDIWCQGFSEPNAGSDLASLRTSAVRDGDALDRQRPEDVEHARPPRELVRAARAHRSRARRSTRASRACSST